MKRVSKYAAISTMEYQSVIKTGNYDNWIETD
jgi:hypothetical protein